MILSSYVPWNKLFYLELRCLFFGTENVYPQMPVGRDTHAFQIEILFVQQELIGDPCHSKEYDVIDYSTYYDTVWLNKISNNLYFTFNKRSYYFVFL